MARQRDYAAEYARRQARARQHGFSSYWQERQTRATVKRLELEPRAEREFVARSKASRDPAETRRLWAEGQAAMRRKDHDEARRIARRLGYRDAPSGPPQRVFFYH